MSFRSCQAEYGKALELREKRYLSMVGKDTLENNWGYYKIFRYIKRGADAVDFRTQTKIKVYSFNFKDPSFLFRFLVPNINKYIRLPLNGSKKSPYRQKSPMSFYEYFKVYFITV